MRIYKYQYCLCDNKAKNKKRGDKRFTVVGNTKKRGNKYQKHDKIFQTQKYKFHEYRENTSNEKKEVPQQENDIPKTGIIKLPQHRGKN